jgi:LacI family transcriptional regulator
MLAWRDRPTAVFASSDEQASGALRAIRGAGLRCPEDVAVVSFDGTSESEFTTPPLTVARQPIHAMAAAAVTTVLKPEPIPGYQRFATELVLRESCGCSPGRQQPP